MNARTGAEIVRSSLRQAVSAWTPGIKPTWTIAEVTHALRMHREGVFSFSAMLIDTLGEDDQIPQLLEKRCDAIFQNDFELQPVDGPDPAFSKQIVEQIEPIWWDMFPESELDDLYRWYKMAGVGLATLDWHKTAKQWKPYLRALPLHFLRYDEFTRRWLYQTREGELEVTPGDGKWILLADGQRGWMKGLVRQISIPWIRKQLHLRDWNRYNERHGLPIIKAMAPAIADEEDKDEFWEDLQDLASEAVAQLPTHMDEHGAQFDLELLEAKDRSWESFKQAIERDDRKFTVIFLGGNVSTEVASTGANRATSENHDEQLAKKASADEKRLSTELRKQGLWPAVALNIQSARFEVTPWPHWDTSLPEDRKERAEGQRTFAETVGELKKSGYEVENIKEVAEDHGLQLKKIEEPKTDPSVPPVPGDQDVDEDPAQDRAAPPKNSGKLRAFALASGAALNENRGFIEGQLYGDALAEQSAAKAKNSIKPTMAAILEELDAATDYDDLRARLTARYEQLSPEEISRLVRDTMVLADLNGRYAVNQDA